MFPYERNSEILSCDRDSGRRPKTHSRCTVCLPKLLVEQRKFKTYINKLTFSKHVDFLVHPKVISSYSQVTNKFRILSYLCIIS